MEYLREAVFEDGEQIHRLIVALEGTAIDIRQFQIIYKANLMNPDIYYVVYEDKCTVLGFISVHVQKILHHTAAVAEIQELIVDEVVRQCGIGKRLFQNAKEIAVKNGCTQIEVCCNQKRVSSHQFYQSQGMTNHHYKFCLLL